MLEQAILALCINLNGTPYQGACTSTLTAVTVQSQLQADINRLTQDLEKTLGFNKEKIIYTAAGFTYTLFVQHRVQTSVSARPLAETVGMNLSEEAQNVVLTWVF